MPSQQRKMYIYYANEHGKLLSKTPFKIKVGNNDQRVLYDVIEENLRNMDCMDLVISIRLIKYPPRNSRYVLSSNGPVNESSLLSDVLPEHSTLCVYPNLYTPRMQTMRHNRVRAAPTAPSRWKRAKRAVRALSSKRRRLSKP
mmetsp:Transcript_28246/g.31378  ORF Transcript_28246/g.31378 Transcript_28246/m.31378 type:complete len:143 (-) Transcript_28246:247-675(-)